jgi:hypothetical protein
MGVPCEMKAENGYYFVNVGTDNETLIYILEDDVYISDYIDETTPLNEFLIDGDTLTEAVVMTLSEYRVQIEDAYNNGYAGLGLDDHEEESNG